MKKIILIALFGLVLFQAKAQNPTNPVTKAMTVEEANKLNGVAQPTINGKPYSQYKAEQDALKQQQATKQQASVAVADPMSLKATGPDLNKPVMPKTNMNKGQDQKETGPEVKATEPVVTKKEEIKTADVIAQPVIDFSSASVTHSNAAITPVQKIEQQGATRTPEQIEAAKKEAQTKVQPVEAQKADATNATVLPAGLKLEAAPAAEKVTPVEQKVTPGTTDTPTKTKTN